MTGLIKKQIQSAFPSDYPTALAVFTAESGLNPKAENYNCSYGTVSTSCRPGDEGNAWSVDCGLAQINFPGLKECPPYAYSVSYSLERATEKHAANGWLPWSAYKNGSYLRTMDL